MASFMKMLRGKKNSNKENVPNLNRSVIDRSSNRSMNTSNIVYVGERRHPELNPANPWSSITAPKTTKGPRSCPGAPMDSRRASTRERSQWSSASSACGPKPFTDRYLQNNINSMPYENLRGKPLDQIAESFHEYGSGNNGPSPPIRSHNSRNRREYHHQNQRHDVDNNRYYDRYNYSASDDDEEQEDPRDAKIRHLEQKYRSLKKRYQEAMDERRRSIFYLEDDIRKYKEREEKHQAYFNTHIAKLVKQIKEANNRISDLEDKNAELEQRGKESSSLLICPSFSSSQDNGEIGAGEALCHVDGVFESIPQKLIQLDLEKKDVDELDTQDEIRVFRTTECETPPLEMARSIDSPIELSTLKPFIDKLTSHSQLPQRSLSDTDIPTLIQFEEDQVTVREQRQLHKQEEYRKRLEKTPYIKPRIDYETSSASSDEEACRAFERQLRKKGEVVKYHPPRTTVQAKHYKKFGKNERTALNEFEFLQGIQTDVSGMLSSPDINQLLTRSGTA